MCFSRIGHSLGWPMSPDLPIGQTDTLPTSPPRRESDALFSAGRISWKRVGTTDCRNRLIVICSERICSSSQNSTWILIDLFSVGSHSAQTRHTPSAVSLSSLWNNITGWISTEKWMLDLSSKLSLHMRDRCVSTGDKISNSATTTYPYIIIDQTQLRLAF